MARGFLPGLLSVVLAGCGGADHAEIVPVRGRVLLDGKPLAAKNVGFRPLAGTPGHGAAGRSRSDGGFELVAVVPGAVTMHKGACVGSYAVVVSEPDLAAEAEPGQSVSRGSGVRVPAVYQDSATTPLRAEVSRKAGEFVFELSSKAK